MNNIENKIRDKLINSLDIFDSDLSYLEKEKYLPNLSGTRGFVDILAKDYLNRFVIIELKRSKSASREAIHEVLKYIEGIKENKSLKDDEIIAFIVSTEWQELIVPFSIFVKDVSYEVIGFKLIVDKNNTPISAKKIIPLCLNNERLFSDYHTLALYESKDNLKKGIKSFKECYEEKNIEDYVLVELDTPRIPYTNKMLENLQLMFSDPSSSKPPKPVTEYKHILYTAAQIMSEEQYWEIIKNDRDIYEETRSIYDQSNTKKEKIHILHETVLSEIPPNAYLDFYEMSYPAKFSERLLGDGGWNILQIIRNGKILHNELLSDETIIGELKGNSGTNKVKYFKEFNSNNKSSFKKILKEVSDCLVDNPYWLTGLTKAINEIKELSKEKELIGEVSIFNPSNTLLSIYLTESKDCPDESFCYFPSYQVYIEGKGLKKIYYGSLSYNKNNSSLEDIFSNFFDNRKEKLIITQSWGGYLDNDYDISESFGLQYSNFMLEITDYKYNNISTLYEPVISYFKYNGFKYIPSEATTPEGDIAKFLDKESKFCTEVISFFSSHDTGTGAYQIINEEY